MENVSVEEAAISLAHLHILSAEIAADTLLGPEDLSDQGQCLARAAFRLGYICRTKEELR